MNICEEVENLLHILFTCQVCMWMAVECIINYISIAINFLSKRRIFAYVLFLGRELCEIVIYDTFFL